MKILDLYCGAGGAGVGYCWAGFDVVGVDIKPQPRYPYQFHLGDALEFLANNDLSSFGAIHASPPCQRFSRASRRWNPEEKYPDLIAPTRELLLLTKKPYIIENVAGAPLIRPFFLCGTMFELNVIRHRKFETNFPVKKLFHEAHRAPVMRKARDGTDRWVQRTAYQTVAGHGGSGYDIKLEDWREAMGIYWMKRAELIEAIPPAYTEYIGTELLKFLKNN